MRTTTQLSTLRLLILVSAGVTAATALTTGVLACSEKEDEDDGDSGTSDGGSGDAGADGGSTGTPCEGATELLDPDGVFTGFVQCPDGAVNRVDSRTWDPTIVADRCRGDEESRSCDTDADCTDRAHGACLTGEVKGGFAPERYCSCVYSCASDTDCPAGELCVGLGVTAGVSSWPECVPAECSTSTDCPSSECGIEAWHDGCGWNVDLLCRTEADECRSDDDCEDSCGVGYDEDAFACQEADCAIGRPLSTADGMRTAPTVASEAWTAEVRPTVALPRKARRRLASHWAEVAAMEHASVASFSRFTLELMALGAPPELLLATQQALADEIRHARLAYGLASAYAGRPIGPGPLSLDGVHASQDPAEILRALVVEACVGETLGAAEARASAEACEDTAIAEVLVRIAEDESRHAALAWRCLRWILETRPELHAVAVEAFDEALAGWQEEGARSDLSAHGVLGAKARAAVHQATLIQVVAPCRDAILGEVRAAA